MLSMVVYTVERMTILLYEHTEITILSSMISARIRFYERRMFLLIMVMGAHIRFQTDGGNRGYDCEL